MKAVQFIALIKMNNEQIKNTITQDDISNT